MALGLGLSFPHRRRRSGSVGLVASLDWNFAATQSLADAGGNALTFTRSSTAWDFGSNGLLQSVSANTPRYAYDPLTLASLGLRNEPSRSNFVVQSRDLTDAAWVKTTGTALKDQTGIDGAANAASSFTATAVTATVLQTIINASAQRATSVYLKRLVGVGAVEVTQDGTTFTTVSINSSTWTRVGPASATVANPVPGIRLNANGDSVAVDVFQVETASAPSTPIVTTTAGFTRTAESVTVATAALGSSFNPTAGTFVFEGVINELVSNEILYSVDDGTAANMLSGRVSSALAYQTVSTVASVAAGQITIASPAPTIGASAFFAHAYANADYELVVTGGTSGTSASGGLPTVTRFDIGSRAAGSISAITCKRMRYYNSRLSNAQMNAIRGSA